MRQNAQAFFEPFKRQTDNEVETRKPGKAFRLFSSLKDISLEEWNEVVPPTYTSLRPPMLEAIEQSQIPDLEPKYVLLYENGRPIGFAYFQVIAFSVNQIKAFTPTPESSSSLRSKLLAPVSFLAKKIAEKFTVKLLVNGNSFLTGEHGVYIKEDYSTEKAQELIWQAIQEIRNDDRRIKGVLLKDGLSLLGFDNEQIMEKGFFPFATDPNMILTCREDWNHYEDYLLDMSSKYRQRAKSAYKKSKALSVRELKLTDIREKRENLFELFSSVLSENRFLLTTLSPDYFLKMKEKLGDEFKVLGYYKEEKLVAFYTILCHDNYCEAHYLGYQTELNRELKLYQRMLYDMVRFGIKKKTGAISFGRTAMEIKSAVGADSQPYPCYLKINNRFVHFLARPVLANIQLDQWKPRHPFKERKISVV